MSLPAPRQTIPITSPSLSPLPQTLPTNALLSPQYLGGIYSRRTPFGVISGAYTEKMPGTTRGFTLAGAYPARTTVRMPISGAYTESLPGTFGGFTIGGAYPARLKAFATSLSLSMPDFLGQNKFYIMAAVAIGVVILLILHYTRKGKYSKAKLG